MRFRIAVPGLSLYPGDEEHWWRDIHHDDVLRIAARADELGFDYLAVSEHVVIPRELVPVMGPRWVHCTTAMAMLAAATKRIKIAGLIVVPYHDPIMLAK